MCFKRQVRVHSYSNTDTPLSRMSMTTFLPVNGGSFDFFFFVFDPSLDLKIPPSSSHCFWLSPELRAQPPALLYPLKKDFFSLESFFSFFFFFIEGQLIHNIVLVSGTQQSDSVTHRCMYMSIFFFKIFFPLVYCKIINIVGLYSQFLRI